MKCNNSEEITNPDSWGEPERVKTMQGDKTGLNAMSLDMTYFLKQEEDTILCGLISLK